MLIVHKVSLLLLAISAVLVGSQVHASSTNVVTCNQATKTRPDMGVPYNGEVVNDDYKVVAKIPNGLTAWGGVAPGAPFHGFTIFLDKSLKSCIVFDVHIRVDDSDAPKRPESARMLSLGKAESWRQESSATFKNASVTNITTRYAYTHDGETDDGEILLVTPTKQLSKFVPVYGAFLNSFRVGS